MRITRLQAEAFDPGMELTLFTADAPQAGAIVSFTGRVRPQTADGRPLTAMTLEHYPGMTETEMARIAEEAAQRWPLEGLLVLHRFGRMVPSEPIVFVATSAAHRRPAFEAAVFLMDWLKTKAPFWKLEETLAGKAWVAAKEADAQAAARWGSFPAPPAMRSV